MPNATCNQSIVSIDPKSREQLIPEFLFYQLSAMYSQIRELTGDNERSGLSISIIKTIEIALPPLAEQERLVVDLEKHRRVIESARQVLASYNPTVLVDPNWPMVDVGEVVEFVSGLTLSIPECEDTDGVPIISINNISEDGHIVFDDVRKIKVPKGKRAEFLRKGDLLFNWRNGSRRLVGKTALWNYDGDYVFASFLLGVRPKQNLLNSVYLWSLLNTYRKEGQYQQMMRQNVNGLFNREELRLVKIPLPSLDTQRALVSELESEQALVEANRVLANRFEHKLQRKLAGIWGEEGH